jgi:hypothetical protein
MPPLIEIPIHGEMSITAAPARNCFCSAFNGPQIAKRKKAPSKKATSENRRE